MSEQQSFFSAIQAVGSSVDEPLFHQMSTDSEYYSLNGDDDGGVSRNMSSICQPMNASGRTPFFVTPDIVDEPNSFPSINDLGDSSQFDFRKYYTEPVGQRRLNMNFDDIPRLGLIGPDPLLVSVTLSKQWDNMYLPF
jgi:hypothetical protein